MIVIICYGISLIVYLFILLWGILGKHDGEYFGYGLFSFYFILPVVSFLGALVLGALKTYWKWLYPILFGIFGFIIPVIVFKRVAQIPGGIYYIPALIGLLTGLLILKSR